MALVLGREGPAHEPIVIGLREIDLAAQSGHAVTHHRSPDRRAR